MKITYSIFAIFIFFIAGSCIGTYGSPAIVSMLDQKHLKEFDDYILCKAYGFSQSENVRRELENRKIFTILDWEVIDKKQVKIGMSVCALYASWGVPDNENRSVSRYGTTIQHVYGRDYPVYVYSEDGFVTGWQD